MTESEKKKIADILEKYGVIVGYLFGVALYKKEEKIFYIDMAVLFEEDISQKESFRKELLLSADLKRELALGYVNLINLSLTDPFTKHKIVLCEGESLYVKDTEVKLELERRTLYDYEDAYHLREIAYLAVEGV